VTSTLETHPGAQPSPGRFGRVLGGVTRSPVARDGALAFYAGSWVFNLSGLGFHMLLSRSLGAHSYGALGSLLGLVLVLQVPIGSMEVALTRQVAARPGTARVDLSLRTTMAQTVAVAGAIALGLVVAAPLLRSYLHLSSLAPVLALAAVIVPSFANLVPRALLLATHRFKRVGLALAVASVGRVVVGPALVAGGLGVPGALLGVAAAEVAGGVVLCGPVLGTLLRRGGDAVRLRAHDLGLATAAFAGFWAMLAVDTVLVRHLVDGGAAGLYAASATAARAGVFFPAAIAMAAFPRFASADASAADRAEALRHALILVGATAGLIALALAAAPGVLTSLAFGPEFKGSGSTLVLLAVAATAMALVQLLLFFLLSTMSKAALLCWPGVAVVALAAYAWPRPHTIATAVALVAVGLLVAALTASMPRLRRAAGRRRRASTRRRPGPAAATGS
jgi:O-antigen/teichoic acid export membrane protein